jgi:hypothetical protein
VIPAGIPTIERYIETLRRWIADAHEHAAAHRDRVSWRESTDWRFELELYLEALREIGTMIDPAGRTGPPLASTAEVMAMAGYTEDVRLAASYIDALYDGDPRHAALAGFELCAAALMHLETWLHHNSTRSTNTQHSSTGGRAR